MSTTLTISIEKEDKDLIEDLSKKEDLSVSQFTRRALREYIDRIKKESK